MDWTQKAKTIQEKVARLNTSQFKRVFIKHLVQKVNTETTD